MGDEQQVDDPAELVVRAAEMIVEAEWFLLTVMLPHPDGGDPRP
ncbi:hypothetical protein [Jatrophihabitans fulvus]